jgi:hypothetical protein
MIFVKASNKNILELVLKSLQEWKALKSVSRVKLVQYKKII